MKNKTLKIKKFKKGDNVKVVAGKDKGKSGKIEKVFSKESKVLVEGVNLYKRHQKAKAQGQKSEIITISKPLPLANVAFICPKCKKQTRIGFNEKGARFCRKCGEEL
ncbi:50S ribosomal protein L24 [Patescibacteria group bacterium]|nr:50S ribosomal protein L24 [Patescibacteria group bacterium]